MTDEKQAAPEADDWLDDLGADEAGADEIDQATIDQLLGASDDGAKEEEAAAGADGVDQAAIDQLLGASDDDAKGEEAAAGADEIDQAAIDQLLGASDDGAKEEEAAAGADEIDQATIDQLLGASDDGAKEEEAAAGAAGDGLVEIDQASLDSLLNGDDSKDNGDLSPPDSGADDAALDQPSIEALLGTDDEDFHAALADSSNVPSQADIDELFAQAQEDGVPPGAPARGDADRDELPAKGSSGGPPAPKKEKPGSEPPGFDLEKPASVSPPDEEATLDEDIFGEETISQPPAAGKPWQKLLPARLLAGASRRSLWGGLLAAVLLLGGGVSVVVMRHSAREKVVFSPLATPSPVPQAAPAAAASPSAPQAPQAATTEAPPPPEARGMEYQMPEGGGEVPLRLAAKGRHDSTLTYEITAPPQHGRLAGKLPTPVYLPNKDFPGKDLIKYRVAEGNEYSKPATILITGPDLRPAEEQEEPALPRRKPREPVPQAPDITLKTLSTRELVIDWRNIWQQANSGPFSPKVHVEIVGKDLHGRLLTIGPRKNRFIPDRLFSGSESISYRFRLGKVTSRTAELRLLVKLGDFPPEIRFRSLPKKSYLVGETVVLDASPTVDDDPAALKFTWRQVAGTPVKLEPLNAKGSMVSFVVPSSFYTEEDPGPALELTVTDRSGQKDRKMVKIATRTRRHSPLWEGVAIDGRPLHAAPRPEGSSPALQPGIVLR